MSEPIEQLIREARERGKAGPHNGWVSDALVLTLAQALESRLPTPASATGETERERIIQSNDVADIDLRYGIADALWEAGYRKVDWTAVVNLLHEWGVADGDLGVFSRGLHLIAHLERGGTLEEYGRPDKQDGGESLG